MQEPTTHNDATDPDRLLTLPEVAFRGGIRLDPLRIATRTNPAVMRLVVNAGGRRCIRAGDIDRVRELLAARPARAS